MKRKSAKAYADVLLRTASQAKVSDLPLLLEHFMGQLRSQRAVRLLPAIVRAAERALQQENGVRHASIHVASLQSHPDKLAHSALGKSAKAEIIEDKGLVGGAVVRMGDTQVDSSIRTALAKLTHQLEG